MGHAMRRKCLVRGTEAPSLSVGCNSPLCFGEYARAGETILSNNEIVYERFGVSIACGCGVSDGETHQVLISKLDFVVGQTAHIPSRRFPGIGDGVAIS